MAGDEVRLQAPRFDEAVEGDLDGEQRGLGVAGLVECFRVLAPDDVFEGGVEVVQDVVERLGEGGEARVQVLAHAEALGTLAGEQERLLGAGGGALDQAGGGGAVDQGLEAGAEVADDGRAVVERRAGGRERVGEVERWGVDVEEPLGLGAQRLAGTARDQERHGSGFASPGGAWPGDSRPGDSRPGDSRPGDSRPGGA